MLLLGTMCGMWLQPSVIRVVKASNAGWAFRGFHPWALPHVAMTRLPCVVEVCSGHRSQCPCDVVLSASTQRQDPKGGELCHTTVKPWETVVEAGRAVLTCKSFVRVWHRGERLIEPPSSWFPLKFPSGSLESGSLDWHRILIDAVCCVG